jgi:long-chain acyl-CoA synthetase
MNGILDFFGKSLRKFPNKTAVITKEKKCTYEELDQFVDSIASALSKYPQKSVISIIMENSIDAIASYLGTLRSGCIAHLISQTVSKHNLAEQLNSAEPKLILGTKSSLDKIDTSIEKTDFETVLANQIYRNKRKNHPEDIAYLIYTSGTTSKPKGVAVSHLNVAFTTQNIVNVLGYTEIDMDVLPLPLSHSFGLGCLHTSFCVGSTLILHKNTMNPLEIFESIKEYEATTFAAVPSTLTKLLNEYPDRMEQYFSNLRLVITNSITIPKETVMNFRQILKKGKLATYYGLTEASRSTFMIFNSSGKESSVGLPAPGIKIKLVDENNRETDNGQIWIKGSNVIKNYWHDEVLDNVIVDGWIKTGDLGYLDNDGYLYLKGRIDDMINVAGEKVNPLEVESVVKILADVEEAAAIGIKHEVFGQVVKLFVKKITNSPITKSDIMGHCIKNLERYKVPIHIEFVDDFPRTEYGKIKRFMLQ